MKSMRMIYRWLMYWKQMNFKTTSIKDISCIMVSAISISYWMIRRQFISVFQNRTLVTSAWLCFKYSRNPQTPRITRIPVKWVEYDEKPNWKNSLVTSNIRRIPKPQKSPESQSNGWSTTKSRIEKIVLLLQIFAESPTPKNLPNPSHRGGVQRKAEMKK